MEVLGYVVSIFMGLSMGLLGAGGAILTVPILVYFFSVEPTSATVDSLFIVGMTSLVGAVIAKIKDRVNLKVALLFAFPGLLGVSFAKYILLPQLPDPVFSIGSLVLSKSILIMTVFATLMLSSATVMIRGRKKVSEEPNNQTYYIKVGLQGLFVGFITGFTGAGGGFLIMPALIGLVGLPMQIAIGTSLVVISINSSIAFLAGLHKGYLPDWTLLFSLLMISLVGFFIGSYFSQKTSEKTLKKIFGILLIIIALSIIFDQLSQL